MKLKKFVRPNLKNFDPYIPGKPISELKRELRIKKIIKVASNENPMGPSPLAVKEIIRASKNAFIYPPGDCYELRGVLSRLLRIDPGELIFGSGSDEIIELLGKCFLNSNDSIVVSEHAFIRYKMAGDLMGCGIISVPMKNYTHDLDAMAGRIRARLPKIFLLMVLSIV